MTKRPIIGITAGEVYNKEHPWSPYVFGQSYTYVEAVIRAGGVPVIFPITSDREVTDELFGAVDGVLFAGGNDVTPRYYGQAPAHATDNSEARDEFELYLIRRVIDAHKPLLGICRGMQLLNIACGGTLYQDIVADIENSTSHRSSDEAESIEHIAHVLRVEPGSKLAGILGASSIRTNSHHHQAVNQLGEGLVANAYAEDGIIEGIEGLDERYIVGIQSHPESLFYRAEPEWMKLFESFVRASTVTVTATDQPREMMV